MLSGSRVVFLGAGTRLTGVVAAGAGGHRRVLVPVAEERPPTIDLMVNDWDYRIPYPFIQQIRGRPSTIR